MSNQGIYAGPIDNSPNRDRRPTEKQVKWRIRNQILWRLKGMVNPSTCDVGVLTDTERSAINEAFSLIREVCDKSTESSIELGFRAVRRCKFCGKPVYIDDLCKKHYREYGK